MYPKKEKKKKNVSKKRKEEKKYKLAFFLYRTMEYYIYMNITNYIHR
jgi:hypothetical protein